MIRKTFKHTFKLKDSPLPTSFIPSKKDTPNTDAEIKEVKIRFGNLNDRSVIGAPLYVSCCIRPAITYVVNKLAKFSNNPGMTHFRALLHLIGYIKKNSNKGIKFYTNIKDTLIMPVLQENNIQITQDTIVMISDSS